MRQNTQISSKKVNAFLLLLRGDTQNIIIAQPNGNKFWRLKCHWGNVEMAKGSGQEQGIGENLTHSGGAADQEQAD